MNNNGVDIAGGHTGTAINLKTATDRFGNAAHAYDFPKSLT